MKSKILSVLPVVGIMALAMQARGDVVDFSFSGSGVSGSGTITYSPQAGGVDTISDVSGVFSDSNAGLNIVNATIGNIVAINPVVVRCRLRLPPLTSANMRSPMACPQCLRARCCLMTTISIRAARRRCARIIRSSAARLMCMACCSRSPMAMWWICGAMASRPARLTRRFMALRWRTLTTLMTM